MTLYMKPGAFVVGEEKNNGTLGFSFVGMYSFDMVPEGQLF